MTAFCTVRPSSTSNATATASTTDAATASGNDPDDWLCWRDWTPEHADINRRAIAPHQGGTINVKLFRCPNDAEWQQRLDINYPMGFSYQVNYLVCNQFGPRMRRTSIRAPSQKIIVVDGSRETVANGAWCPLHNVNGIYNTISIRHTQRPELSQDWTIGSGNVAFVHHDGIPV